YCPLRARCVKSPLITNNDGCFDRTSPTNPSTAAGSIRPKCRSEMCAIVRTQDRIDTADHAARTVAAYIEIDMDEPIEIEPLRRDDRADFDALWRIYQESITGSERKGRSMLRRMFEGTDYRFLIARMKSAGICGLAIVYHSP